MFHLIPVLGAIPVQLQQCLHVPTSSMSSVTFLSTGEGPDPSSPSYLLLHK